MAIEDSKILITGGAGHIGSALVWALNQRGFDNILITDQQLEVANKFKNLVPLKFDDYMEADQFMQVLPEDPSLFEDIKTVFHLGAYTSDKNHTGKELIENNYEYSKVICSWALGNGARFIYASGADTCDKNKEVDENTDDLHQFRPQSMYSYSKHLFDLNAQRHGILDYMAGIKYFNLFGPNEAHKASAKSIIYKIWKDITSGEAKKTYLPRKTKETNLLYIKDAVQMTLFLAENRTANGIFNIASNQFHTEAELYKYVLSGMNPNTAPKEEKSTSPQNDAIARKIYSNGYTQDETPISHAVKDYIINYLAPNKYLGDE